MALLTLRQQLGCHSRGPWVNQRLSELAPTARKNEKRATRELLLSHSIIRREQQVALAR